MRYLVDQSKSVISSQDYKEGELSSEYGSDDDEDVLSDHDEECDIVQELKSQISHLVELGPTLHQNVTYARKALTESSFPSVVPFHLSNPAKIYVALVRERYRNAQDQLVDRLGESNWQMHKMVREQMENPERRMEKEDSVEEDVPKLKRQDELYSAFRPHSAFHDSGIGTSVPAHTQYAASHTSFLSSNSEGLQGSLRVPSTPDEVGLGKPFKCPFCKSNLLHIKNRIDWKSVLPCPSYPDDELTSVTTRMHVFADLRPYICTFANCNMELAQFTTRAAWAEHEFSQHRIVGLWSCPECADHCESEAAWIEHLENFHQRIFSGPHLQVAKQMSYTTQEKPIEKEACPLCQVVLGKSRREFVKHVGRHMEEIALMSLPRQNGDESEADSTSTMAKSSRYSTSAKESLEHSRTGSDRLQGSLVAVEYESHTSSLSPSGSKHQDSALYDIDSLLLRKSQHVPVDRDLDLDQSCPVVPPGSPVERPFTASDEVICPLTNQDGSICRKRRLGVSASLIVVLDHYAHCKY